MYHLENHGNIHENAGKWNFAEFFQWRGGGDGGLEKSCRFSHASRPGSGVYFRLSSCQKIGVFHILKVTVDGQIPHQLVTIGEYETV